MSQHRSYCVVRTQRHRASTTTEGIDTMDTRELVANYTTYTDALEMSHSAAADTTARTSPACISAASAITAVSVDNTFDHSC